MAAHTTKMRLIALAFGAAIASTVLPMGIGSAEGKTLYFPGTGGATPTINDGDVNTQKQRGWRPEIAGVYGTRSMDESVVADNSRLANEVRNGGVDSLHGFSLGGVKADEVAAAAGNPAGVRLIVDGSPRQPGTGALVVLKPWHDSLQSVGITTGGQKANVHTTYRCISYDPICGGGILRDPLRAGLGYVLYHSGVDRKYNYRNLNKLEHTSVSHGNTTIETYSAPDPVQRVQEIVAPAPVPAAAPAPASAVVPAPVSAPAPVTSVPTPVVNQVANDVDRVIPGAGKAVRDFAGQFGF